jgi:hypothetical protein
MQNNCYSSEGNRPVNNAYKIDVYETMLILKEYLSAVAQLKIVDDFVISYPKYSCPAELCTPSNLDMIIRNIENIE